MCYLLQAALQTQLNDLKKSANQQQTSDQETIDTLRSQLRESSSHLNESNENIKRLTALLAQRAGEVDELNQKISLGEVELKTKVKNTFDVLIIILKNNNNCNN